MKRTILLIFLGLLFSNIVFSQEKSVKEEGWIFPDISGLKSKFETNEKKDGVVVKISEMDLEDRKPSIFIEQIKDSETKTELFCEVRKAKSYSVNNKIFGYGFRCVYFAVNDFEKEYYAAMTDYYYLDEDGDGKFETRYNRFNLDMKPPDWVKNLK